MPRRRFSFAGAVVKIADVFAVDTSIDAWCAAGFPLARD